MNFSVTLWLHVQLAWADIARKKLNVIKAHGQNCSWLRRVSLAHTDAVLCVQLSRDIWYYVWDLYSNVCDYGI